MKTYRFAYIASDGMAEPELREPMQALRKAGAKVDLVAPHADTVRAVLCNAECDAQPVEVPVDKRLEAVSPEAYDGVIIPAAAIEHGQVRLEGEAREFVCEMQKAGKPVLSMPVPIEHEVAPVPDAPVTTSAVRGLLKETFRRWMDINVARLGAALAYYTVLSMAPLLVVTVGIAGLAFGRAAAQGQIEWQIQNLVGTQGAEAIKSLLAATQKPASGVAATVVGLLALLFGASGVFIELRDSLNYVWGVKTPSQGFRGMVVSRFFSFAMVVAIGFLLLVSLVLSAGVAAVGKVVGGYLPLPEWVLHVLTAVVSLLVFTAIFALLYKVVPDLPVDWNDVWIGAAVTSFLFSVGKFLIGLYLGKAGIGSAYGAAGSLVVLLAWVYYSAQIFFLGAEFTHIYAARHGSLAREASRH